MTEYAVSWGINLDAEDGPDAAAQAWAMLNDAVRPGGYATILVVRDAADEEHIGTFDMSDGLIRDIYR